MADAKQAAVALPVGAITVPMKTTDARGPYPSRREALNKLSGQCKSSHGGYKAQHRNFHGSIWLPERKTAHCWHFTPGRPILLQKLWIRDHALTTWLDYVNGIIRSDFVQAERDLSFMVLEMKAWVRDPKHRPSWNAGLQTHIHTYGNVKLLPEQNAQRQAKNHIE